MIFDANRVADYFIWKSQEEANPVTNKKLQKLLYYAQAWNLTLNKSPLFNQDIEAWVHGPAVRDVYFEYKNFGFNPIEKKVDPNTFSFSIEQREVLDQVWQVYGKYDASYLEMLSHSETPWREARAGLNADEGSSNIINLDSMTSFYSKKREEAAAKK